MYKINDKKLENFTFRMQEQYIKDLTYRNYIKYPLVNFGMDFSEVLKKVSIRYNLLKSKGIDQRKNLEFWLEIFFIFGFDFLNKKEFIEILEILENKRGFGELELSLHVYEKIKDPCLGFDDITLISKNLKNNIYKESTFENFVNAISENFLNYYIFMNQDSFWLDFYTKNSSNFSLNETIVKALNFDVDYKKIEKKLCQ